MQLIIHAGLPKTGSTAIQTTLALNRESLAEAGFIYPKLDRDRPDRNVMKRKQGALSAFWVDKSNKDMSRWSEDIQRDLGEVLVAADKSGDVVILSHEGIGRRGSGELSQYFLQYTDNVHILAYVRPPADLYASLLQQKLKKLRRNHKLARVTPVRWKPYKSIDRLVREFGKDRLEIRIFSRDILIGGDVIADFCEFVERKSGRVLPPLEPSPKSNESLPGWACALLVPLRRNMAAGKDDDDYHRARKLLGSYARTNRSPKLRPPDKWLGLITASNGESWNRLVDMSSHDESQKAALRIPPTSAEGSVSEEELEAWIMSYADGNHVREFIRFCRSSEDPRDGSIAQRIEYLASGHAKIAAE
jgi:hypothetical protein